MAARRTSSKSNQKHLVRLSQRTRWSILPRNIESRSGKFDILGFSKSSTGTRDTENGDTWERDEDKRKHQKTIVQILFAELREIFQVYHIDEGMAWITRHEILRRSNR